MSAFRRYRRKQLSELRPYVEGEALSDRVSVSPADRDAGHPRVGDMIARNPENHDDQWLMAADYFAANFEVAEDTGSAAPAVHRADQDLSSAPPEGFVLVPREPTEAMVEFGMGAPRSPETQAATNSYDRHAGLARDIYRAMIAAAPEPSARRVDEGGEEGISVAPSTTLPADTPPVTDRSKDNA